MTITMTIQIEIQQSLQYFWTIIWCNPSGLPEDKSRGEVDHWPSHPKQMGLGKWRFILTGENNITATILS